MTGDRQDNTDLEMLTNATGEGLALLFAKHRERLWRMVNFRLDRRLSGRLDTDDILQEAYLDAADRLQSYLEAPRMLPYVWLRLIVGQTMINVHRRHLGTEKRNAGREVSLHRPTMPKASSISLAGQLLGHLTSPSQAALREEMTFQLEQALEGLEEIDHEVLVLRHFEELTNREVAEVLGIQHKAASIRYVRAMARLKSALEKVPGFSVIE